VRDPHPDILRWAPTAALTALLIGASITPLAKVYAVNPKQVPTDLRGAFEYIVSQTGPNDLLLEATTRTGGGPPFTPYNSYFLRPAVWRGGTAGMIDDPKFPKALDSYAQRSGQLNVLLSVGESEQRAVKDRAGSTFDTRCFRRICGIR